MFNFIKNRTRERERESKLTHRLILFLKKESQKSFFYSALFFASLFLIIFAFDAVFAWNSPTANPPSGSGAISYYNGNVGIGTTAPFNLGFWIDSTNSGLHIKGQQMAALLIEGGSGATISLYDQGAGINQKNVRLATDNGKTFFGTINDNDTFKDPNVLVIDNNNSNIGIGTMAPTKKLEVNGAMGFTGGTGPFCIFSNACPTGWIDKGLGGYIYYSSGGATCPYIVGALYSVEWPWCHPRICCNE